MFWLARQKPFEGQNTKRKSLRNISTFQQLVQFFDIDQSVTLRSRINASPRLLIFEKISDPLVLIKTPVYQFSQTFFSEVNQKSLYFLKLAYLVLFLFIFDVFEEDFQTFKPLSNKKSPYTESDRKNFGTPFIQTPPFLLYLQKFRISFYSNPLPFIWDLRVEIK